MPDDEEEESNGVYWELKVSRVPWDPRKHLSGTDYIFSMLLEIPEMYYVVPDKTVAFVYVWGRGVIRVHSDFSQLDEMQTSMFVNFVRRDLSS